jgi:hypothetical protein
MVWPSVAGVVFIRRVLTASGATAVQIAEYVRGNQRIVQHVGSAHTEAELASCCSAPVSCLKTRRKVSLTWVWSQRHR